VTTKASRRSPTHRQRSNRRPRWLPQMQEAQRLVAAATEVHGRHRHDLLVEAAKIVAALREPRTDGVLFERLSFRRSRRLVEVAIATLGTCVGCLASATSLADKQIFARVKRVVNEADPIGLLSTGAPDDEYHPEIDEIACRLPEPDCQTSAQTHAMVHRVFVKWFNARIAGPRSAYRKLATALHALRPLVEDSTSKHRERTRGER